jgi:hypothetical protein
MAWRNSAFILLIMGAGLFSGWFSARVMLDRAASNPTQDQAGWREVKLDGEGLWSTYQSGHYLWRGKLPPPQHARLFRRETDDDGQTLRSDCSVLVEGVVPKARWWMISADNGNEAHSLSAGTVIREPNGTFSVTLGANAAQGNWLKLSGSRAYSIYLTLDDAREEDMKAMELPQVRRLWC